VPKDDDPKIDISVLKPKNSMYNEEGVLDFWWKRFPSEKFLEELCKHVLLEFTGDKDLLKDMGYRDLGIYPVMLVNDGNSMIGPFIWNTSGHRNVHNGEKALDLIKEEWPKSFGVGKSASQIPIYKPPFKEFFYWDSVHSGPPEEKLSGTISSFDQWSYDQDGYPINGHPSDYQTEGEGRFQVRIAITLRFVKS
jgi:hypothetical protein